MSLVEMSVPRPVAALLPRSYRYSRSYPALADRSFGGNELLRIAVWLAEQDWPLSDGHDSPLAVAARLRFQRWRCEAEFLMRGGRL